MSDSSVRTLTVCKRWGHHTASGGFDRLAQEAGGVVLRRNPEETTIPRQVARRIWKGCAGPRSYMLDYRYEDWFLEWSVLAKCRFLPVDIVHFLYGDEQLDALLRHRRLLPFPLVATFHLPTWRLQERFEKAQAHLKSGIDAVVVVSTSQLPDFRNWLGADKVVYVPHGIDTARFCPAPFQPEGPLKLIAVGHHLRDWTALHQIIDACHSKGIPAEFDVVTSRDFNPYLTGCAGVRLHHGVSEEKLLEMYRKADALLVPVLDATANNAVLEAMACGTPVISTRVGGIPDYVDDASGFLFEKGEVDGIVELLGECARDRKILSSRRPAARQKSLEFSWDRVAAQMQVVYRSVLAKRPVAADLLAWLESSGSLTAPKTA